MLQGRVEQLGLRHWKNKILHKIIRLLFAAAVKSYIVHHRGDVSLLHYKTVVGNPFL